MTRFPDDLQATISEVVASTTGRRSEGKPSVVCVSGGRGSGKNTHARVAANAILFAQGRVAVLDGDCANPLFGAPGVLTLSVFDEPIPAVGSNACFSERWLKRRAPLAAAFVGPTCARDNPAAYAASLERLTRAWARFRAREDAEKDATTRGPTVLVVNCAVWSKGLGADLVMKTTQLAAATHVLRFGAARSLDAQKNDSEGGEKNVVARAPADAGAGVLQWMVWGMECVLVHDRDGDFLADRNGLASTTDGDDDATDDDATRRFLLGEDGIGYEKTTGSHQRRRSEKEKKSLGVSETDPNVWAFLADRFTALQPWKVRVADVAVLVEDGSGALARAREPPDIVVGSVAGLCFVGGDGGDDDDDEAKRFFPACHGLGLIRSATVDASGAIDFVYVLTPLSAAALESVNALVCRHAYPPSRLCVASGVASVSSPPFWTGASLAAEGTGAGVIRSRNNILRKGGAGNTKRP